MVIKPDSQIASPIQVQALVNRLEARLVQLHDHGVKQRLGVKTADQSDQQLLGDLRLLGVSIDLIDSKAIKQMVRVIKDWLKVAPVVHLTFSALPPSSDRVAIIDWFHQHISPSVLVDFRVDSHLAAGFILRTKNRIYNYSGNDKLWQNRHQLVEMVKHV